MQGCPSTATRATAGFGRAMIVLGTGQALRVAFTRLGDGAAEARVKARIDTAVEAVLEPVLANGTPFLDHADGRLVNPGQAIEGA